MSTRLELPFEQWPKRDREAWERAIAPAKSILAPSSSIVHLRPRTIRARRDVYGLWLSFLARRGCLTPDDPISAIVTPDMMRIFVAEQQQRGNNNGVIVRRLGNLRAALRMLVPGSDFDFILRIDGMTLGQALPHKPRRVSVQDSHDLLRRTFALYEAGCRGEAYAEGRAAIRDAAILGILITRAPRVGSIAAMEIGRHLKLGHAGYRVTFSAADLKTGPRLSYNLEETLTPILNHYISLVRPAFGGALTTKLWLGTKRHALDVAGIAKMVRRRTKDWFEDGRGPQWFRKCLTTTVALDAPELMSEVAMVQNHSVKIGLAHYNMATTTAAALRHERRVSSLRLKADGLCEIPSQAYPPQTATSSGLFLKPIVRLKSFGSLSNAKFSGYGSNQK